MKILLTGACGYVGSVLVMKLRAVGHAVSGIDMHWFRDDPMVEHADIRYIRGFNGVDAIIHLAAISNDPSVSAYPRLSWETSVLATQQLAQMAAKTGCRFIYASSVSVYGADRGLVTEDMDLHPLSDYNKTKMCAERILLSYPEIKPQIIRPATICGLSPRMRLDLTVNKLTIDALTKGVITVHGGEQYRPSIHIDDMCDLYLWMLEHPEHVGIWNAGFENHRIVEIADIVQELVGGVVEIDRTVKDARSYRVDSSKVLAAGFRPKKYIDDAVREIAAAYEAKQLVPDPTMVNLTWMQHLGIKDE